MNGIYVGSSQRSNSTNIFPRRFEHPLNVRVQMGGEKGLRRTSQRSNSTDIFPGQFEHPYIEKRVGGNLLPFFTF